MQGLIDVFGGLVAFIAGVLLNGFINKKEKQSEFNRGYDLAIEQMTKYGYWYEKNHKARHEGKWIEFEVKKSDT